MAADDRAGPAACPVSQQARDVWLKHARKTPQTPLTQTASPEPAGCDSEFFDRPLSGPSAGSKSHLGQVALRQDREVSSIPRALSRASDDGDAGEKRMPDNWIYPSEAMFFNAMRRKRSHPRVEDMRSIVPIHNAVNERVWREIQTWEKGRGAESCGGPKLVAFSGNSQHLTPRARWNALLGYQLPFDRHDWVVDRCGTTVEYVIDFYAGRDEGRAGKSVNLYLDVRPKLNGWEGVKTRVWRFWGL